MRLGLVALMLIACGGKGAVLEIHTTADHVDVYASAADCSVTSNGSSASCPRAIAWASAGPKAAVDSSFALLEGFPITVPVRGGVASLELRAPVDQDTLERIVVVGYDSAGMPVASGRIAGTIEIPQGKQDAWRLDLQPSEDINVIADPNAGPRAGVVQRVHTWPIDGIRHCIAWQQYDGTAWTREVIAPDDDHDCDGFADGANVECDDFWFRYKLTTTGGTCTQSGVAGPGNACTVGKETGSCIDGSGGSGGCVQSTGPIYCVADTVCSSCANPLDASCPATQYDANALAPHIGCGMPAIGTGGTIVPCMVNGVTSTVVLPFGCTQATLTSRDLPPTVVIGPGGTSFVDGGATLSWHVTVGSASCQIDLTWTGGTPSSSVLQFTLDAYVDVNGSQRAIVLPIAYNFNPQLPCDAGTVCSMNLQMGSGSPGGGDRIWDCLGN